MFSVIGEFFRGVGLFFRGFTTWATSPGLMALGAIPALIVGLVFLGALVGVMAWAPGAVEWATPFAGQWDEGWRVTLRVALSIALIAGTVALGVMTFAAITLTVAAPFIDRISELTERRLGGIENRIDETVWTSIKRGVRDGLVLIGTGIVTGLIVTVVGLIPIIGGVLGWTTGAFVGGRALAIELTGTPGDARGITLRERQRMLGERRPLALGFGVCAYLMFLVPGGAVVGTPAAAVGGTLLLRELVGEPTRAADSASGS